MKVTNEMLISAIKGSAGNVQVILDRIRDAYKISISRQAVEQRKKNDEEIAKAFYEEREHTKDFVENAFLKKVRDGNVTAMIFYLKTQCKDRGYLERREITGQDGAPLQTGEVKIYIPDNGRDKNGD